MKSEITIPAEWIDEIEKSPNVISAEERKKEIEFVRLYRDTKSVNAMAKACGRSKEYINRIIRDDL